MKDPTTKSELLAAMREARREWNSWIAKVSPERMSEPVAPWRVVGEGHPGPHHRIRPLAGPGSGAEIAKTARLMAGRPQPGPVQRRVARTDPRPHPDRGAGRFTARIRRDGSGGRSAQRGLPVWDAPCRRACRMKCSHSSCSRANRTGITTTTCQPSRTGWLGFPDSPGRFSRTGVPLDT